MKGKHIKSLLSLIIVILFSAISLLPFPVFAASDYTITYVSGSEGEFTNSTTTNSVTYKGDLADVVHIVKSSNVTDKNTSTGAFLQSSATHQTVTIAGASKLSVTATYRFGGSVSSSRYLSIFSAPSSSGTTTTNKTAYVGGTTKTTNTYTINGDTTDI